MGIFTEIGRRVEKFKQTAENAAESAETVRCPACDAQFDSAHEHCPECGAEMVESTETAESPETKE